MRCDGRRTVCSLFLPPVRFDHTSSRLSAVRSAYWAKGVSNVFWLFASFCKATKGCYTGDMLPHLTPCPYLKEWVIGEPGFPLWIPAIRFDRMTSELWAHKVKRRATPAPCRFFARVSWCTSAMWWKGDRGSLCEYPLTVSIGRPCSYEPHALTLWAKGGFFAMIVTGFELVTLGFVMIRFRGLPTRPSAAFVSLLDMNVSKCIY